MQMFSHDLVYLLLLVFFSIHFLLDLNFISTIRGNVNHAVIIHELLTCFLFQVLFNITSHEIGPYYITAVIIPVIKTAYCEIYYKARQPLVSSFCSNPGLSDDSVKWNAPTKISCKCDDKQQPLLMMSMHFILWRKSKRNVKWLNHCLAIWTLLFKLERECCCQVILDVKEYVQSDDSSAVGPGVALLRFQKAKSTTFVASDSYKVNFIANQGGY